jgi:hypothetical protein
MSESFKSEQERKVEAHRELVRRAAGFLTAADIKTPIKNEEYKRHELNAIGREFDAHKSHAPYQIILRKAAKAIEREDNVRKENVRKERSGIRIVPLRLSPPLPYTEEMKAMHQWRWSYMYSKEKAKRRRKEEAFHQWASSLEPPFESESALEESFLDFYNGRTVYDFLRMHDGTPEGVWEVFDEARRIVDIAFYTNDKEKATEALYVGDKAEVTNPTSKERRKQARLGWNKRKSNIVIVLSADSLLKRTTLVTSQSEHPNHPRKKGTAYNVARFSPTLTAFLAAMAPHAPNRHLVIKYCIQQLIHVKFHIAPYRNSELFHHQWLKDDMLEWYAFHLLRRMFRMRFGCSLFPQPETTGPLSEIRKGQDLAWLYYKNQVGKIYRGL